MDPRALVSALAKCKAFTASDLESIPLCSRERVQRILSIVENGSDDVATEFLTALNDLGYCDIVKLIDPSDIQSKAGKFILFST